MYLHLNSTQILAYKKRQNMKKKKFPTKNIFFYLYLMQLFSADAIVLFFKTNFIFFLTMKKWKNGPQKLLIIGPTPFFFTVQPRPHSPELIFHIMKSWDLTSVLLSVFISTYYIRVFGGFFNHLPLTHPPILISLRHSSLRKLGFLCERCLSSLVDIDNFSMGHNPPFF